MFLESLLAGGVASGVVTLNSPCSVDEISPPKVATQARCTFTCSKQEISMFSVSATSQNQALQAVYSFLS
jgi:hypothetical protein